jgi:hypothetical protein
LEVTDSPITGRGVCALAKLKDLEALYLINTQIGDDALESIGHFKKLKTLNLSGSRITDAGMRHIEGLVGLENLALEHTAISDACLVSLCKLKRLSWIHLTGTRVTEAGANELRKRLPNLRLIFLRQRGQVL